MKLLLSLCLVGLAAAAPAPQEEAAPEAVAYVHEEIEALPYVHEDIPAEAYVHEEPVETHDIAAEAYVHEEVEAEAYVHQEPAPAPVVSYAVAPVAYAGYPYTYSLPVATAPAASTEVKAAAAPVATYAVAAAPYYYAALHTGCVNSVGSVVPCA